MHPFRTLVMLMIAATVVTLGVFHYCVVAMDVRDQVAVLVALFVLAFFAFLAVFAMEAYLAGVVPLAAVATAFVAYLIFTDFAANVVIIGGATVILVFKFADFALGESDLLRTHVFGCVAIEMAAIAAGMLVPLPWGLVVAGAGIAILAAIAVKYPALAESVAVSKSAA